MIELDCRERGIDFVPTREEMLRGGTAYWFCPECRGASAREEEQRTVSAQLAATLRRSVPRCDAISRRIAGPVRAAATSGRRPALPIEDRDRRGALACRPGPNTASVVSRLMTRGGRGRIGHVSIR
jgi:hypothetical protein